MWIYLFPQNLSAIFWDKNTMKSLNEYIRKFDEDTDIKELEKFDYVVYTRPDGITYYGVKKDAPEEAHHLASAAALGNDIAADEIEKKYKT